MKNKNTEITTAENDMDELLKQSILFCVDSLSNELQKINDIDTNLKRAEAIKTLVEAYKMI